MRSRYRSMLSAGLIAAGIVVATTAFSPAANAADDEDYYESTCAVAVEVNGWETGNTTNVTVTYDGEESVEGWELTFLLPDGQEITNAWNTEVSQDGGYISATSLDYNALIAPGASVSFGYQIAYGEDSDTETGPDDFELNGVVCSVD